MAAAVAWYRFRPKPSPIEAEAPRITAAARSGLAAHNPKGHLQELAQSRWKQSPVYTLLSASGPAHQTEFTVRVTLPDGRSADGQGRSKQLAESEAAAQLLSAILSEPPVS